VPVVEERIDDVGIGKARANFPEAARRDAVRRQSETVGIGTPDGATGEGQIHADCVRHARKGPAHPVVGEEADAGLGHGEAIALAGNAMRAVERNADA
jgi:hypothetical protein